MSKTRAIEPSEHDQSTRPDASAPQAQLSRRANFIAAAFAFALAIVGMLLLATIVQAQTTAPTSEVAAAQERPMMVVATRLLRVGSIVGPNDVALLPMPKAAAATATLASLDEAIGLETRVSVYDGRPIRPGELGPPTLIKRNEIVTLRFLAGGLSIQTEGRALDAGGLGERIRVMNLDSRRTVTGSVAGRQLVVMQ